MCGIVGFTGNSGAAEVLLDGLRRLEYRGYDSAGIALIHKRKLQVVKEKGRVSRLAELTGEGRLLSGSIGIGHTRWATHGEPHRKNAHPHVSADGRFAVVHNGIIENYLTLKAELEAEGVVFKSDTDTEVIPNLIAKYFEGDLLSAVRKAVSRLEGSFALGILFSDLPDTLIAVKHFSPLIVGLAKESNLIASDLSALIPYTRRVIYPEDGELVLLTPEDVAFFSQKGEKIEKEPQLLDAHTQTADKLGFEHFMLKEIYEQPEVAEKLISRYLTPEGIVFEDLDYARLRKTDRVRFVACGSAYHAGAVAKVITEELTEIPCENDLASEFRYSSPILGENTLTVVISQSGETADTLAALKEAKSRGGYTLAVVNTVGSAIAKEADAVIYTRAGIEVAVATTKGYLTQLICLTLFALFLAELLGKDNRETQALLINELRQLPQLLSKCLTETENLKELAKRCCYTESLFFMGRGIDYAVAQEASLKLKEISYIHSEAYAAGELKHGTISLICHGTPVFALGGSGRLKEKLLSNIKEVKARGGFVALCASTDDLELRKVCDEFIPIPEFHPLLSPIGQIIPLQLFAYYSALERDCDIDKPRNLAKSVTVE